MSEQWAVFSTINNSVSGFPVQNLTDADICRRMFLEGGFVCHFMTVANKDTFPSPEIKKEVLHRNTLFLMNRIPQVPYP